MLLRNLFEAKMPSADAAFAFGRFNPAHQGHIEVYKAVQAAGNKWFVGTNPSTQGPNDPLTFEQKAAWMNAIYPPIKGHILAEQSVVTLASKLYEMLGDDKTIAYVTDSNDWAWAGKLLNDYNGKEGPHGYYKFKAIKHVESPRVSSATALRTAARANDEAAFYAASGTDPKITVGGKTYFETVVDAVGAHPEKVKKVAKKKEPAVAEGQTPEQEIERLKLRQNAEHGKAPLRRHAATQARIRELEKQIKDKKVKEGKKPQHNLGVGWMLDKDKALGQKVTQNKARARQEKDTMQKYAGKKDVTKSVAKGSLSEFAPGNGDSESGRWYTDDQMTDIVGDGWWEDLDVSGNISKQEMIEQAQDWLDDQGYSVQVLNAKLNDDDMDWFIEGSFHNPGFAKKGVAEGAPIIVMPRSDRFGTKKPAQPYRNQDDIVPPTKPPSTEKRGVKGRAGQRPMPKYDESAAIAQTAKRLTDPKDGATAKLRAAGDKRREDQLKSRNIAKKNETVDLKTSLQELSNDMLGKYKKAAGDDAKKADAAGDFKRGDKRFKGINKATVKQFDNDAKKPK